MNSNHPASRVGHTGGDRSSTGSHLFYRKVPGVVGAPEAHTAARAALARGDHAGAVEEYRKVVEANPEDALAILQIARTACEHLDNPGLAAATLEEALTREWPQEEAALLCMELVDLNWNRYRDAATARALLVQIKESMPGTPFARDAQKRLHEITEEAAREARQ